MFRLLTDTIRRPQNTKKQSKGSSSYIDQKKLFYKREKNED